jgi:hypothetical protein
MEEGGRKESKVMAKTVFEKVLWLGRTTAFCVGLAVILALTVGLASAALAGTGAGSAFNLGKTNTVNAVTRLVGSVAGNSLFIDNNSTNASATALNLQVEAGRAPMKVNSQTKVANLNADKLDGMDAGQLGRFRTLRLSTTDVTSHGSTGDRNGIGTASCQPGEQAISGGVRLQQGSVDQIFYFTPSGEPLVDTATDRITGWQAAWFTTVDSVVRVYAVCAS